MGICVKGETKPQWIYKQREVTHQGCQLLPKFARNIEIQEMFKLEVGIFLDLKYWKLNLDDKYKLKFDKK